MKASFKFLCISFLAGFICFTACKKPDNSTPQQVPSTDTGCRSWNIRVDGKCTFDTSNWFRDEFGGTMPRWMRDSLWVSEDKCTMFDFTLIYVASVDPAHPNVRLLRWMDSRIEGTYDGGLVSGNLPVNYWPNPILGDSVEWGMPFAGSYAIVFNGRFNTTQDTIRGMLRYQPIINSLPPIAPCGPIMFRKVRVVQVP